jgi:hypothetical protein
MRCIESFSSSFREKISRESTMAMKTKTNPRMMDRKTGNIFFDLSNIPSGYFSVSPDGQAGHYDSIANE